MKNTTVFYKKIGRRYVPARTSDTLMESVPFGYHLLEVRPGQKTTYHNIDPAYAVLMAAWLTVSPKMVEAIVEKSRFVADANSSTRFEAPSTCDCVNAGFEVLKAEIEKQLAIPAVKNAYDHFLLVCELTKEDDNVKL